MAILQRNGGTVRSAIMILNTEPKLSTPTESAFLTIIKQVISLPEPSMSVYHLRCANILSC